MFKSAGAQCFLATIDIDIATYDLNSHSKMRVIQSLSLFAAAASALSPAGWRSQSIYQILTDRFANDAGTTTQGCSLGNYCGGTWRGIINKLDYIQGMGFTAIWISPVVKNIGGTTYGYPYHGYWAQDIYSLNPNFGTPADLKDLAAKLHERGMYLMVDVAPNHYASASTPAAVDYSKLIPFNDKKYYHPYCKTDYTNKTSVQNCWAGDEVVPLPDLRDEDAAVQDGMNKWIGQLVANYSIDGLRLDSAIAVHETFWPGFGNASKVFNMGEVLLGNPDEFGQWQKVMDGMLNYPTYYWLTRAFGGTNATMTELTNNIAWLRGATTDTTLLGNFLENHDAPRFASRTTDVGLLNNAVAFTTFNDGIPVVYYGQEQLFSGVSDPNNREAFWPSKYAKSPMYNFIGKLNAARNIAIFKDSTYVTTKAKVIYSDQKVLVLSKGAASSPLITLMNNYGSGGYSSVTVSNVPASVAFTDLLTCEVFTSTSAGKITLPIVNGQPRALYKKSTLSGDNLCASGTITTSTSKVVKPTTTSKPTSTTTALPLPSSIKCPANNGTTFTTSSDKSFVVECGIDHPGGDMAKITAKDLPACIAKCASSSTCQAAILSGTTCYLKSSLTKAVSSGVTGARLLPPKPGTAAACSESSVAVTFHANVTTIYGEAAKILGSDTRLGAWSTANAVLLSSAGYSTTNTIWSGTVAFPPSTYFEYKIIKVNSTSGAVKYEGGDNRLYTVPCAKTVTLKDTFQ